MHIDKKKNHITHQKHCPSKMGSVEMLRVSAGHPEHAWMVIQLLTIPKIRQGLTGFTA